MSAALQASLRRFQWDEADGGLLLWEAQRRAVFARLSAEAMGVDSDYAYVAGMLQDLLLPCLKRGYPKDYSTITAAGGSICEGERKQFGWDHGLVTAGLLKAWNFPEEVVLCVACHHDIEILLEDHELQRTIVGANIAAGMLPDLMRQEPEGLRRLVHIQEKVPEFEFFQIAAETDEELERIEPGSRNPSPCPRRSTAWRWGRWKSNGRSRRGSALNWAVTSSRKRSARGRWERCIEPAMPCCVGPRPSS